MYTSDINIKKAGIVYLLISLFCMVFGAVYEVFSHEVYSGFMIYAFAFPLIGGALPFCIWALSDAKVHINRVSFNLWNSGIAAFTAGSILRGILEIYGTTNKIISAYWVIGAVFAVSAFVFHLIRSKNFKTDSEI